MATVTSTTAFVTGTQGFGIVLQQPGQMAYRGFAFMQNVFVMIRDFWDASMSTPYTGQIFPTGAFTNFGTSIASTIEEIELDSNTTDTWEVE